MPHCHKLISAFLLLLHVSANSCAMAQPLDVKLSQGASLIEARDLICSRRKSGALGQTSIIFTSGTDHVNRALQLDSRDNNLTLRAAPGSSPRLAGTTLITNFSPRSEQIFALGGEHQFGLRGWRGGDSLHTSCLPSMIKAYQSVANQENWKKCAA